MYPLRDTKENYLAKKPRGFQLRNQEARKKKEILYRL